MSIALIGRKCGMSRVFKEDGTSVPVTVIELTPNRVTQIKKDETDGYTAIQLTAGSKRPDKLNKALVGHYAKAKVEPGRKLWECRVRDELLQDIKVGDEIPVTHFAVGTKVDVTGVSKGHGFSGVVKRHNFSMQRATHGNSLAHRAPGSIGQNQTPGRVFKGKKMAGQMGNTKVTIQSLEIVDIQEAINVILVKGAIPGAPGGDVLISSATKCGDVAAGAA